MKCPKCASENHPDACFCARCGEPLAIEPVTPPESIEVHIEGGVSGQVAIGNNILQIGNVYGGVVNVAMPEQKPRPQPRPTPVSLRPRPFPGLLDREAEVVAATTALQSATPVEFYGQAGLGKTALLRHLAHHPTADAFPAGVVYLSARRQPVEDLLQSLFGDVSGGRVVVGEKAIQPSQTAGGGETFCSSCGSWLTPGDRFCNRCGAAK